MLVAAEASVNMPTDHDLRSDPLDRIKEFAATDVLHAARVQVEGAVAVIDRRLMRYKDVDTVGDGRVDSLELARPLHERPAHERVGPGRRPHGHFATRA